jgi:hypothetical protein
MPCYASIGGSRRVTSRHSVQDVRVSSSAFWVELMAPLDKSDCRGAISGNIKSSDMALQVASGVGHGAAAAIRSTLVAGGPQAGFAVLPTLVKKMQENARQRGSLQEVGGGNRNLWPLRTARCNLGDYGPQDRALKV